MYLNKTYLKLHTETKYYVQEAYVTSVLIGFNEEDADDKNQRVCKKTYFFPLNVAKHTNTQTSRSVRSVMLWHSGRGGRCSHYHGNNTLISCCTASSGNRGISGLAAGHGE